MKSAPLLQERVYRKFVMDVDELKLRLIGAWSGIHQSIIDQSVVDANGKHFEHIL